MYYLFMSYALCLSVAAGLLFPLIGAVTNFQKFFHDHTRWFFGAMIIANCLDVVEVFSKANAGIRPVPEVYVPFMLAVVAGFAIAMFTNNRRFHALFAVAYFLLGAGYDAVVFSTIG